MTARSETAALGARWAATAYDHLEEKLGRAPNTEELGDFMMAAIDVVFSSTYGVLRDRDGDDAVRSWTAKVMSEISNSLRSTVKAEVSIQIVSKE